MNPTEILAHHQLKRTSCREGIIEIMMGLPYALSENEIRMQLQAHYDRTTFYRSLKTLEKNHIIHKIVVDAQLVKYALEHSYESLEHAHFYCKECHAVECIENLPIDGLSLPDGYIELEAKLVIKGICSSCNNNSK